MDGLYTENYDGVLDSRADELNNLLTEFNLK